MSDSDFNASPVNPLPPIIVALALVMFGGEVVLQAGEAGFVGGQAATGWRLEAISRWGFYDPQFDWMVENRQVRWAFLARLLTYPFVHSGFMHMMLALVFVLALGKMVAEVFRPWAVLVVFFGATITGAIAYGLIWDTQAILFGGFPAAYGLIGAYSFLLWTSLGATGGNRVQAFTLIAILMGVQLVFGLFFGAGYDWVADLAGFAAGFLLSFVVSPGGWGRVMAKLRRR